MVIFGGLEILAAGYVLNELGKDEAKAQDNEKRKRRRRHHNHDHEHRDSDHRPRPQRPPQQSLRPPVIGPPRPNSAPPVQLYQRPAQPGPWQNNSPNPQQFQHQQNHQPQRPPNPQTWPQQQPNSSAMFRPQDFPANPHQPPPPYSQKPPPPGPGHLQSRPTMHFDMKTGKWQANMLPPEMPRSNSMPVNNESGHNRPRSTSQQPPSRLRDGRRAYSTGSWSSSETDSDSDHDDHDLAYGHLPGKKQPASGYAAGLAPPAALGKTVSHERERPMPPGQQYQSYQAAQHQQPQEVHGQSRRQYLPVERDWYAAQDRRRGANNAPAEMEQPMRYELP